MSNLIESLESRNLFSVNVSAAISADAAQAAIDGGALRFQFQQHAPVLQGDLQAVNAAVRAAGTPKPGVLVARMNAASARDFSVIRADSLKLLSTENAGIRLVIGDLVRLAAKPTSAALKAKLNADAIRVNVQMNAASNTLGAHGSALGATAAAAVAAVGTAFASDAGVTNAISTLESDGSAFLSTIGVTIQAIQTDTSTLLADAVAGK